MSASSASASSSLPDLIPVVTSTSVKKLYRDVLESAFQFCDVKELASLIKVNRQWCAAVASMPSIRQPSSVREFNLQGLLDSRIARHVSALPFIATSRLVILQVLSERMPWLEELTGELSVFSVAAAAGPIPPLLARFQKMRKLHIVILSQKSKPVEATAEVNRVIAAIGTMLRLESLNILMSNLPVSFAPLIALPCLRSFVFDWHSTGTMSDAQCAELRALPVVEQFWFPAKILPRLLLQPESDPPPAPLKWLSIHSDDDAITVNDELALQLSALLHLTTLRVELGTSDCSFLLHLPQLRTLSLVRPNALIPLDSDALLTSMAPCVGIMDLALQRLDLAAEHLCTMLARLPQLSSLRLQDMLVLTSLRCFATEALAVSLRCLSITNAPRAPLSELDHLIGLRSLESLTLRLHPLAPLGADHANALFLAMQARGSHLSRQALVC